MNIEEVNLSTRIVGSVRGGSVLMTSEPKMKAVMVCEASAHHHVRQRRLRLFNRGHSEESCLANQNSPHQQIR